VALQLSKNCELNYYIGISLGQAIMINQKNALISALVFLIYPFTGYGVNTIVHDDLLIFRNVSENIKNLKSVSYHYSREFIYPSENYNSKSEGEMYIDFSSENDLVGFRYQYWNSATFSIFNNSEIFDGNIQDKTINTTNNLKKSSFEGRAPIYNSIITLRNILPIIIEDKSIVKYVSDTLIANKSYYLLTFEAQNKFPNYLGTAFSTTTKDLTFYQKLIVDKETLLPLTLLQSKKGSGDLNRTDFTEIKIDPVQMPEKSWYYSSYLNDYKVENRQLPTIIKAGQVAPDFNLTNQESGLKESLSKYKGQVILLEFWIKNCGYCIEAVSKLNTLNNRYKSANFKMIGINTEDSKNSIDLFIKKYDVKYSVLWGDSVDVNKSYGISSFPQVVLLDNAGIVIYSGHLDTQILSELIDKNM